MGIKKIIASAVLFASLLTVGIADPIMNTQPVAQANAAEDILAGIVVGAIIGAECDRHRDYDYDYDYGYGRGYDPRYDGYDGYGYGPEVVEVHHYHY